MKSSEFIIAGDQSANGKYTLQILRKQKLFAFFDEENCSQIKGCEENEQFLINENRKKRCFWSHLALSANK